MLIQLTYAQRIDIYLYLFINCSQQRLIFFFCQQQLNLSKSWIISFFSNGWFQSATKPASIYWLIVNSLFQVPDNFWARSPENMWEVRVNIYLTGWKYKRLISVASCDLFSFPVWKNGAQAARETIKDLIRKVSQKQRTRQEEATRTRIKIYYH